jgi:hypothetical protein
MLVRIRGEGRVQVAAYGVADAEHLIEKELRNLWPEARLVVTEVRREAGEARIVEELWLSYRLEATLEVEGADAREAERAAFRSARDRLAASHFRHTSWEAVKSAG